MVMIAREMGSDYEGRFQPSKYKVHQGYEYTRQIKRNAANSEQ